MQNNSLNVHVLYTTWFIGVSEVVFIPRKDLISSQGVEEINDAICIIC